MSGAAAIGGSAAAAAHQARLRQEEEEMTPYSPRDLAEDEDWEFKILRSSSAAFKNPERLHAVLNEEARAGWMLVEKFDNSRLRLKRPTSARQLDGKLEFDPYRTYIGLSDVGMAVLVLGIGFSIMLLLFILIIAVTR